MVPLEDLVALYAGEPDLHGGWASTPCPTVALAVAICRLVEPEGLIELLLAVYDGQLIDEVAQGGEVNMLRLGFQHWWQTERRVTVGV